MNNEWWIEGNNYEYVLNTLSSSISRCVIRSLSCYCHSVWTPSLRQYTRKNLVPGSLGLAVWPEGSDKRFTTVSLVKNICTCWRPSSLEQQLLPIRPSSSVPCAGAGPAPWCASLAPLGLLHHQCWNHCAYLQFPPCWVLRKLSKL
jgi:hypothetical protein